MPDVFSFSVTDMFASFATLVLCHMLFSSCYLLSLFYEEAHHVDTRYNNQWKNVFNAVFNPRSKKFGVYCLVFVISLMAVVVYTALVSSQFVLLLPIYVVTRLLMHVIGTMSPRKYEIAQIKDMQSQLGHSFAWQYYYGYLKIILPGLIEKMTKFEVEQKQKIAIHKLVLLMPDTCDLQDLFQYQCGDTDTIERVANLEEEVRNRSGNSNRKYSNTVYRIATNTEPVYLCMEGISMLNSLRDMTNSETRTGLSVKARYQQMCFFYSTLKSILVEEKLDHLVELIFYKERTEEGTSVRLSEVVMERVRQLMCQK